MTNRIKPLSEEVKLRSLHADAMAKLRVRLFEDGTCLTNTGSTSAATMFSGKVTKRLAT